jgi:hypothetical protein
MNIYWDSVYRRHGICRRTNWCCNISKLYGGAYWYSINRQKSFHRCTGMQKYGNVIYRHDIRTHTQIAISIFLWERWSKMIVRWKSINVSTEHVGYIPLRASFLLGLLIYPEDGCIYYKFRFNFTRIRTVLYSVSQIFFNAVQHKRLTAVGIRCGDHATHSLLAKVGNKLRRQAEVARSV